MCDPVIWLISSLWSETILTMHLFYTFFHEQPREGCVHLCAHMSVHDHTYIQEGAKLNYRNSCSEELRVIARSQSKSQAKWPSLNITKACPLFSYISKDKWWILWKVPRNNTSHVFQDLGNAFVCISRPEGLKALGLIMRYLNLRKKRNRYSVLAIFPVALALQRKYFSQL